MVLLVGCVDIQIRHLFVSPGHNYFGHHQKPPGEHAIIEVKEIQCVAGKGIAGDRFFGYKKDYKGQITFFEEETYEDLCGQFGVWDRGPEVLRRNVITRGARLPELIGVEFELQGVRFFGNEECRPCYWMDLAFAVRGRKRHEGARGLASRDSHRRISPPIAVNRRLPRSRKVIPDPLILYQMHAMSNPHSWKTKRSL